MQDPDNKKELDKIPDTDENDDPIYKIDERRDRLGKIISEDIPQTGSPDENEFKNTLQDLKAETSQD